MSKTSVTNYKTERINAFTGGTIKTYQIKEYPGEDGELPNSFVAPDGTYLGDYSRGWWYVKNNMLICNDHPHGVAYVLKQKAKLYPYLDEYIKTGNVDPNCIEGIYGYSHRGGCIFKIGDRLFDEKYNPKKSDYSDKEWKSFEKHWNKVIREYLKKGWYANEEEAKEACPISDLISFNKRGSKTILSWKDAIKAAKNLSNYLR